MKPNIVKVYSSSMNNILFLNKVRNLSTESIKVKPHIPLIKFRKGTNNQLTNSEQNLHSQTSSSSSSSSSAKVQVTCLDEDMTPIKYRRKILTQIEMDAIDQGGLFI